MAEMAIGQVDQANRLILFKGERNQPNQPIAGKPHLLSSKWFGESFPKP